MRVIICGRLRSRLFTPSPLYYFPLPFPRVFFCLPLLLFQFFHPLVHYPSHLHPFLRCFPLPLFSLWFLPLLLYSFLLPLTLSCLLLLLPPYRFTYFLFLCSFSGVFPSYCFLSPSICLVWAVDHYVGFMITVAACL